MLRSGPVADRAAAPGSRPGGFTIIELLIVILLLGLVATMVIPNLGAFIPKARLDGAAKTVVANIDHMRSEARIRSQRCQLEFDLERAMWRRAFPPEERLTTDQDVASFEPKREEWTELEEGVRILGAGNPAQGLLKKGTFELAFDEDGCTDDQVVLLQLIEDPTMIWTIHIRGLTGRCDITRDFKGQQHLPEEVAEGSF